MPKDFYPFVDAESDSQNNLSSVPEPTETGGAPADTVRYATRIAVYDDMLSTPRVIIIEPSDIRSYLEEITNTTYRTMREQGGKISLMVVRELVENFIHADFTEPIISILDDGNTIRFADQGPGIEEKELAFEFGVTSATREQKRYIRGTGAGLPMVEQYLENAGGVISIEDNIRQGTVVTVSIDPARVEEIDQSVSRGAVVRGGTMGRPNAAGTDAFTGTSTQVARRDEQSYQQLHHEFSTIQQPYPLPAYSYPARTGDQPVRDTTQTGGDEGPQISERGLLALDFIAEHGSAGPTELAEAYGESTPTWSRELAKLSNIGLVVKQGQKRVLTELGREWLRRRR